MKRRRAERHTASTYGTLSSAARTDASVDSDELMRNFNPGRGQTQTGFEKGSLYLHIIPEMPRK